MGFAPDLARPIWTGRLTLDLRNNRDWAAGDLELDIRLDTVRISRQGRELAVFDRDYLRSWLLATDPDPYRIEDATLRLAPSRENRARITIEAWPELGPWPISPMGDQRLRERLQVGRHEGCRFAVLLRQSVPVGPAR